MNDKKGVFEDMFSGFENMMKEEYSKIPKSERRKAQSVRDSNKDPKINRNSPCTCGSGKKYKKCCYLTPK